MEEQLDRFEQLLEEGLIKICRMQGLMDEPMGSPDLEAKWDGFIKDYVADAVENFNDFPQTTILPKTFSTLAKTGRRRFRSVC